MIKRVSVLTATVLAVAAGSAHAQTWTSPTNPGQLQHDVDGYRYYPVAQIGLTYRF